MYEINVTSQMIMPMPPTMNRNIRPVRSITEDDITVATKFVALFIYHGPKDRLLAAEPNRSVRRHQERSRQWKV